MVIFPRMTSGKHEDDTLEMRMTNQPKDDAQDDISIVYYRLILFLFLVDSKS